MGKNTDKLYITHDEHMLGSHSASSTGKQQGPQRSAFQRLPFDCCALSLQPFNNPVAIINDGDAKNPTGKEQIRADVFELMNIVPYIRKFKTNPVTGKPLSTDHLISLNFFKNGEGVFADPITYKPFSQHTHIVFLKNTGNVFDMSSLQLLAIKTKSMRDLITEEPFTRKDIVTIQDPENLAGRNLREYDYVKGDKKVQDKDRENDPLKGINVDAAGGAGKVLKMMAKKSEAAATLNKADPEPVPEPVVASREKVQRAYNASNYTMGQASASFTSTSLTPQTKNETAMFDEEEYMFDEMAKSTKEKERVWMKGYATIHTTLGPLNIELHGDRAPKTVYNWIMLAKEGKYDNVIFHRLIPGFMLQGGDPTGTGSGGASYWGNNFRDEYDLRGAYKHDARGVMSMANRGPSTNGSQFFFTFRPTPHLDGKHTVFGRLVDSDDVLSLMEVQPKGKNDKPLQEIKMLGITIVQDPFEEYKKRLNAKLKKTDLSDEVQAERAARKAKREQDRTTWLGTNLGAKGDRRVAEESAAGVGKYLQGAKRAAPQSVEAAATPTEAKKPKKLGSFGDFSGW